MSKFHESIWNYFSSTHKIMAMGQCPANRQDIYGGVLWSMLAQIMFRTLPSYKQAGRMCQNDSKMDNMMYMKSDVVTDIFVRVRRSSQPAVTLRIPTYQRIIYPMDFGFASVHVPGSPYQCVASLAALLYTNIDSVMNTTNVYTDYYQIMLSMLSFHQHFHAAKSPRFQALMQMLLRVLTQTLKLPAEQLRTAGMLESNTDIKTFYVDASNCTINPLPFLIDAMLEYYRYDGPLPSDPRSYIVHDLDL